MAEIIIAQEYQAALIAALVKARAVESAIPDLQRRILRDMPTDLTGYVLSLQGALPTYFEAPLPTEPTAPTGDSPDFNQYFLDNLHKLAGVEAPAAKAAASGTEPPKVIAWEDTAGRLAYVEAIATNKTQVADPVRT